MTESIDDKKNPSENMTKYLEHKIIITPNNSDSRKKALETYIGKPLSDFTDADLMIITCLFFANKLEKG